MRFAVRASSCPPASSRRYGSDVQLSAHCHRPWSIVFIGDSTLRDVMHAALQNLWAMDPAHLGKRIWACHHNTCVFDPPLARGSRRFIFQYLPPERSEGTLAGVKQLPDPPCTVPLRNGTLGSLERNTAAAVAHAIKLRLPNSTSVVVFGGRGHQVLSSENVGVVIDWPRSCARHEHVLQIILRSGAPFTLTGRPIDDVTRAAGKAAAERLGAQSLEHARASEGGHVVWWDVWPLLGNETPLDGRVHWAYKDYHNGTGIRGALNDCLAWQLGDLSPCLFPPRTPSPGLRSHKREDSGVRAR